MAAGTLEEQLRLAQRDQKQRTAHNFAAAFAASSKSGLSSVNIDPNLLAAGKSFFCQPLLLLLSLVSLRSEIQIDCVCAYCKVLKTLLLSCFLCSNKTWCVT